MLYYSVHVPLSAHQQSLHRMGLAQPHSFLVKRRWWNSLDGVPQEMEHPIALPNLRQGDPASQLALTEIHI